MQDFAPAGVALTADELELVSLCRMAGRKDAWNGHYILDLVTIIDRLTTSSPATSAENAQVAEVSEDELARALRDRGAINPVADARALSAQFFIRRRV